MSCTVTVRYTITCRGRLMMPLTMIVHHGLMDGLQISRFFANVEKNMASLIAGEEIFSLEKLTKKSYS